MDGQTDRKREREKELSGVVGERNKKGLVETKRNPRLWE